MVFRRDTPRYQRAVQQLQALRPEVQAVLNPKRLHPLLEQEELNRMAFRKIAMENALRQSAMNLAEKQYRLQRKDLRFRKDMDLAANIIAGLGVPVAGLSGYWGMKERQRLADAYRNALPGRK